MTSLLSCNRCGYELTALNKRGPHIHTICSNCGMDNSSMIESHTSHETEQEVRVEIIRMRHNGHRNVDVDVDAQR